MARYCLVTNLTTQICSLTLQTKYYNSIALLPGEEIYVRSELCNVAGLESVGFSAIDAGEFPGQTDPAFGEAHQRIIDSLFDPRPDLYSWNPSLGYPTFDKTKFEFLPGTVFTAIGPGTIPGSPVSIEVSKYDRIRNIEFNPDGVSNDQWEIVPANLNSLVTLGQLNDAVISASGDGGSYYANGFDPNVSTIPLHPTGGTVRAGDNWTITGNGTFSGITVSIGDTIVASINNPTSPADFHVESNTASIEASPNFFDQFVAVDWLSGTVLSYPLSVHGISHTPGKPFDVQVFDDTGSEVWVCTATNPVTGEVTVTTDGVSFPGSIIISES